LEKTMKRALALCTSVVLGLSLAVFGSVAVASAKDKVPPVTPSVVEIPATNPQADPPADPPADPLVEEPAEEVAEEPAEEPLEDPAEGVDALADPTDGAEATESVVEADATSSIMAVVEEPIVALATYPIVTKVTFCHATGSETNPFVRITTSVSAFFNAGHHEHQGLEDVVPAFSYVKQGVEIDFHGLNLELGQEFIDNNCSSVPSEIAIATIVILPATCEDGEMLILGDPINATWGEGDTDLEGGPVEFSVTATADEGFLFEAGDSVEAEYTVDVSDDRTTKTFTGTLDGPLDPESEECAEPEVPEEPELPTLPLPPTPPTLAVTGGDASGFLGLAAMLFALGIVATIRARRMA
jgi:hypothetical protein